MEWQPQKSLAGILLALGNKIVRVGAEEFATLKMPRMSFSRLMILSSLDGAALSQTELANRLCQSPPSITEILGKLKRERLVKVKNDSADARRKLWSLTKTGKGSLLISSQALRKQGQRIDNFFRTKEISQSEVERCKEILGSLLKEFQSESRQP